jgi:hypothetical protein
MEPPSGQACGVQEQERQLLWQKKEEDSSVRAGRHQRQADVELNSGFFMFSD